MANLERAETVTFQYMLNASLALVRRPAVATFEEYEKNNLQWATIYVAIAAVLSAILGAIAFSIQRPYIEQQLRNAQTQLGGQVDLTGALAGRSVVGAIFSGLLGTLIGFFIFLGLVYLIGRAFGGTGSFGELAFDMSLFWAPLMVVRALISIIAIGPLAILTGLVSFAIAIYNLYLTYLAIQSGMNLPKNKALYVILIIFGIFLVIAVCVLVVFAAALAALFSSTQR
ncbi:MAG TPA: Yip1 family protein [Roseiflexaceae bacterium]|nr:Yip1 family protein [Roseiflexaceae bacterium]